MWQPRTLGEYSRACFWIFLDTNWLLITVLKARACPTQMAGVGRGVGGFPRGGYAGGFAPRGGFAGNPRPATCYKCGGMFLFSAGSGHYRVAYCN